MKSPSFLPKGMAQEAGDLMNDASLALGFAVNSFYRL